MIVVGCTDEGPRSSSTGAPQKERKGGDFPTVANEFERIQRQLRTLGEDFVCLVMPDPQRKPLVAFVRPGRESDARHVLHEAGASRLAVVRVDGRSAPVGEIIGLVRQLRQSAPAGAAVNPQESVEQHRCPRVEISLPVKRDAKAVSEVWARAMLRRFGRNRLVLVRQDVVLD